VREKRVERKLVQPLRDIHMPRTRLALCSEKEDVSSFWERPGFNSLLAGPLPVAAPLRRFAFRFKPAEGKKARRRDRRASLRRTRTLKWG
jgi:hypothetical protein